MSGCARRAGAGRGWGCGEHGSGILKSISELCLPIFSIVCIVEAVETSLTGGIEVDVNGKLGHSPPHVQFTYQVSALPWVGVEGAGDAFQQRLPTALSPFQQQPQPLSVEPKQGPQAGGTTLTITGINLDTGSQEDVDVAIRGIPCKV